jgi:CheY-like chemotaxis protein
MIGLTDTGHGMSEAIMQKAFDPFFTTKPAGYGTGLGLSQVHGFIKQSGGHIKLYSEVETGTTVKLYLPREMSKSEVRPPAAVRDEEILAEGHKVLVVEDDGAVRAFALSALQELGFATAEADNGTIALQRLSEDHEITVLLTDVVMPGLNGRNLVDAVMADHPHLVVLFMTGYTHNAIVHNGMLDPGVRLISKPFTVADLRRELRAALSGSRVPGSQPSRGSTSVERQGLITSA